MPDGIVMDVIAVALEVPLVTDHMFPESALPHTSPTGTALGTGDRSLVSS
jgi:hypothetical protein